MRISFVYILVLAVLTGINACKSPSGTSASPSDEGLFSDRRWYVIEINRNIIQGLDGTRPYLEFNQKRFSGFTGCNRLTGTIEKIDRSALILSAPVATKMFCQNNFIEKNLLETLPAIQQWQLKDGQLLLSSTDSVLIKLQPVSSGLLNLQGTWELDFITGKRIAFRGLYPDKVPFITFDLAVNQVGGNTSCNGFSATYRLSGNEIEFSDALKTMIACDGGGEESFLDMLDRTTHYRVENDTLYFSFDDVIAMRFHKR